MKIKILNISVVLLSIFSIIGCENSSSHEDGQQKTHEENIDSIKTTEETVEINGVKHFIKKIGNGTPLLVLHGGPGMFHDYLVSGFEKLTDDYQIIFYDQRGCGKTDFPTDTASITTENFVNDLESIRKHLGIEKLNLAGHSWGSVLALNYAKKYPNQINSLILIAPAPATSEYFDMMYKNMQKKRSDEDTKELVKLMSSKNFDKREPVTFKKAIMLGDKVNLADQTKVEELYKPMNFTETTANNLLLVNSIMEKSFFNYDITEGLDSISSLTLIIVGDLDNVPFASNQLLQDNLPNARLEVLKKACHYPFFEANKEFNYAVKSFLNPEYE